MADPDGTKRLLQRQCELPPAIELFRYLPERLRFPWRGWSPSLVRTAADLPPYLVLGTLDESSFEVSDHGWGARWQGTESDTHFDVTYLSNEARYDVRQTWCGVNGGSCTSSSQVPLDQLILEALHTHFPSTWDEAARKRLERRHQLTVIEDPRNSFGFCGIPDGPFKTIAIPVAVKNLRPVREWLRNKITNFGLRYPVSAEAKLMFQAINYVEGKAPNWTSREAFAFSDSLAESGTAPHGFPLRETASDGSTAWTLRRDIYVLFIGLPFAGLTDFLVRSSREDGPIRARADPPLRVEMRPVVLPMTIDRQTTSIAFWDEAKTTRSSWHFAQGTKGNRVPSVRGPLESECEAESQLLAAEAISAEVTNAANHIIASSRLAGSWTGW